MARWKVFTDYLTFSKEDIVADIGGGSGEWTRRIAPRVKLVVLIDLEEKRGDYKGVLQKAKKRNQSGNVCFIMADARCIPLRSQSINKSLLNQVLEHLENPMEAFTEISRVLKEGGILVTSCPNSLYLRDWSFPLARMLRRVFPEMVLRFFPSLIIGDFPRIGYDGWQRKVGHVRIGFQLTHLKKFGLSAGLYVSEFTCLHKRLGVVFWELGYCLPIFSVILRPLSYLAYSWDSLTKCSGVDILVKFVKG